MTTRRPIPNTSSSHNHSNHSHAIPDSTFIDLSGADNSSNSSSVTSSHAHGEHETAHGGHSHAHGGHSHAHGHGGHDEHDEHKAAQSVLAQLGGLSGAWRRLAGSRHTATLLAFASAYTLVAGGIFAYGIYCDSLALVADACGQLFACAALAIRLASTVAETATPTSRYAYGLRRLEVLLSFCGGASAVFVALFLIAEAVEHVLHADPHIAGAHLMTAAVVGLLAKLLGALFFYDYMRARSETAQPFEEAGDQWRHLIVDAVCSICVIFNSWLVTWRDATLADAVVAFLLAALLIGAAVPVCLRAGFVLLHTTPAVRRDDLAAATRDAQLLPGVIECRNAHFWTLAPAVYSGSVVVRVRPDANHGQILSSVRDLFSPFVQHLTVGIERDDLLQKS